MLALDGISKSFGGVHAVSDVTMTVTRGEVRGLIGPNGAGKTTLVNLISGLLTPTAGTMTLDDSALDRMDAAARAGMGVARTFQNLRIFSSLTVAQNIEVAEITSRRAGHTGTGLTHDAIERFNLQDKLHLNADALSYGHLRRLEIVRALALRPRVLMLDEPAAGMNEQETAQLGDALAWVSQNLDAAMLVIDHDLKFIMALCDRITVLNMGKVIAEGDPRQITSNHAVIEAYLGEEHHEAA